MRTFDGQDYLTTLNVDVGSIEVDMTYDLYGYLSDQVTAGVDANGPSGNYTVPREVIATGMQVFVTAPPSSTLQLDLWVDGVFTASWCTIPIGAYLSPITIFPSSLTLPVGAKVRLSAISPDSSVRGISIMIFAKRT
jgi:hypothetical protein